MKRLMMLMLVALAIPATAFAAISDSGGGTKIADGKATLVSDGSAGVDGYSYISFDDLNGQPLSALNGLSAEVLSGSGWGGGSPRFSVRVSGPSLEEQRIFVYLGDLPNFATGHTGSTGNLLADGTRVDSTQLGGPFYGTWADALAKAASGGYDKIANIALVVDGGWNAPQTFVFDAVSINGTMNPFGPVCEATGFRRDGINLTAAVINPTSPVTGTVDASGCDIGVYYGPGAQAGSVTGAKISNAKYFGVVNDGRNVNVKDSHHLGYR